MAWTKFTDMHSGGGPLKVGFYEVWIEADQSAAVELFENIFKHDPDNVTCNCCGEDFWYDECPLGAVKAGSAVITMTDIEKFRSGKRISYQR